MDGEDGKHHPILAGRIAHKYLDDRAFYGDAYSALCLFHSRYTAKDLEREPSKLCWADKLSCKYDPWWLYLPRAILSGEINEYRQSAAEFGAVPLMASNREWYAWAQPRMIGKAYRQDARVAYEKNS